MEVPKWNVEVQENNIVEGDTITVFFEAKIPEDWYMYSSDFDPKLGPMVTEFNFYENEQFERLGNVEAIGQKKKYDELFEGEYTYFTKKAKFKQRFVIHSESPDIKGLVSYQICSDVNGQCIPFESDVAVFNNVLKKPLDTAKSDADASTPMVLEAFDNDFETTETEGQGLSFLLTFFFISFGAGLIALLTPCVFPMIPMTVSYFTKSNTSRKKGIAYAILYGVSIIAIYTIVGTLFSVLFGADFANFLSTHWIPNLFFFAIFIIFALSFFGLFEITLPNKFVNKIDSKSNKSGVLGIFFMAFTLVLVSFSCTGPIAGTILLQAANGDTIQPIVGMLGFSLAFALPFTLFAVFPNWLKSLPKSGGWLDTVKVVLGFIELALALKFFSIVDQVYHWDILNREVYLALWIVIFAFLGFYLLGKITFPHEQKQQKTSVGRIISALLVFSFVVYLIPGLVGAPLKALAGYMPPLSSQSFVMNSPQVTSISNNTMKTAECGVPKYGDLLELPLGIQGYFDYTQALECAKKQDKPLFIDFTGHGCVNCREMEATVWSDPKVLKRLKEDYVVVALYVDEKTELPEKEWYVSAHDERLKKTIGGQNLDFMIQRLNANAQPYYTLVDTNGSLLNAPKGYDLSVQNFVEFLDNGLEEFKIRNTKDVLVNSDSEGVNHNPIIN
ncbi:thiol:disulfide interchange protein DsbD precursor [Leeuwenhoekiella blandensis MED217]|uniref:Thiol:disulfide interchange protein DsbD n=3 Tax=Flavobacteriaceae TaxID=49546 RepID=A3XIW5_LEEBM|nr:thiol:disulfide interchange protein DsbD precursor [Leeuwenhoekiella blandensis MED217]